MLVTEKAKLDAEDTRNAYWAAGFPVDPERIAHQMGIRVERIALDPDTSGMLVVEPYEDPVVYLNEAHAQPRQRFTLAHELGHYVERTQEGKSDFNLIEKRGGKYDLHEFYADEFAGNLLMPKDDFRRRIDAGGRLAGLAAHYGVSLPAVQMRAARLGIQL